MTSSFQPIHSIVPPAQSMTNMSSTHINHNMTTAHLDTFVSSPWTTFCGLAIQVLKELMALNNPAKFGIKDSWMISMGFTHDEISPCQFIKYLNSKLS